MSQLSKKLLGMSCLLFSIISFGERPDKVVKLNDSVITTENL